MSAPAASHRTLGERLAGGVIFPLWARREHPAYARFRRDLEASQYWAADRIAELQQRRLSALLDHAARHCPLYRQRFAAAGVGPGTRPDDPAWKALPLLTKADLQERGAEVEAEGFPPAQRQRNQTGGSTGSPVQYWVDRERYATRMASTHRHNAWAGPLPGDWLAEVWGAPLDRLAEHGWWNRSRNRLLYRTIGLNTSSIGPEDWGRFFEAVRRRRPRWLVAYASGAVELADEVQRRGADDIQFAAIITSAEVLSTDQRRRIEAALGGKVFNRYGCREVSVIASECETHQGLHINAEALLVELVPSDGLPEGWGKVVVTDLLNRSQPLIRYENGDVARWATGSCACGRGLPRLAEVEGRVADFIHLPSGRLVSGVAVLTLALADVAGARQLQLVERAPGDLLLRVVPGRSYSEETRQELDRRLQRHFHGEARLQIETVAAIAPAASGKLLFVVHEAQPAPGAAGAK